MDANHADPSSAPFYFLRIVSSQMPTAWRVSQSTGEEILYYSSFAASAAEYADSSFVQRHAWVWLQARKPVALAYVWTRMSGGGRDVNNQRYRGFTRQQKTLRNGFEHQNKV